MPSPIFKWHDFQKMYRGRFLKILRCSQLLFPSFKKVFDSALKHRQRQKSYDLIGGDYYEYLREECASRWSQL